MAGAAATAGSTRRAGKPRKGPRPDLSLVLLREAISGGFSALKDGQPRVDRERGIIHGVKIVGRSSPNRHGQAGVNGTDYTLEALTAEVGMLEGINVNVDHPPRSRPGESRSARDRFAWLESVTIQEAGSFGNLCFLDPSDPLAVKMMNAAERKPDAFALSHNAMGRGEVKGGRYVVTEIVEVRSVDIVADGGTNLSLFEGLETVEKKTLRQLLEACKGGDKDKLMEMGEATDMMDAEPADAWKQHLVDAIGELVCSESDDDHGMAKKILGMLKPVTEEDDSEDEPAAKGDDDSSDDKGDDDKKDKKMEESRRRRAPTDPTVRKLQEQLDELKADKAKTELREWVRGELTRVKLLEDKALVDSCLVLKDKKQITSLLESIRDKVRPAAGRTAPRSQGQQYTRPLAEAREAKDSKEFASLLLS